MSDNNSNKTTTNEFVNPTCLDGLEILREHRLVFLNTPQPVDIFAALCQPGNGVLPTSDGNGNQQEESKETFSSNELLTSWQSDKVQFDNNGCLVSLDLGGKRLHKGIPCDPCVFGKFQKLKILSLAGTDLPLKDILAILQEVAANNNGNYNDNDSGSSSIESLYLGGNGLGNVGIEAIVASKLFHLPNSSNLTKLDLRYNDIGSVGMGAICRAVMGDNGEDGNAASTTTTTTTTSTSTMRVRPQHRSSWSPSFCSPAFGWCLPPGAFSFSCCCPTTAKFYNSTNRLSLAVAIRQSTNGYGLARCPSFFFCQWRQPHSPAGAVIVGWCKKKNSKNKMTLPAALILLVAQLMALLIAPSLAVKENNNSRVVGPPRLVEHVQKTVARINTNTGW
eukprot:CAMPEP_0168262060 /NCGR_PEP_ID=MMETSP0141_2-20121125/9468_1 /TAXON_ID=44445 /ORGANISM="Pseudo-nitzschia australis, Strain 10249 10 AB" /LENGTH=391 /DNA_ID=CAMNT_0008200365 /DNA_START=64 /DNA_END=1236 /DNA_ORIENTATION=+